MFTPPHVVWLSAAPWIIANRGPAHFLRELRPQVNRKREAELQRQLLLLLLEDWFRFRKGTESVGLGPVCAAAGSSMETCVYGSVLVQTAD